MSEWKKRALAAEAHIITLLNIIEKQDEVEEYLNRKVAECDETIRAECACDLCADHRTIINEGLVREPVMSQCRWADPVATIVKPIRRFCTVHRCWTQHNQHKTQCPVGILEAQVQAVRELCDRQVDYAYDSAPEYVYVSVNDVRHALDGA